MADADAPVHPRVQLTVRIDRVTVAARTQLYGVEYLVTVTAHRHPKNAALWVFNAATPDGTYRSGNKDFEDVPDERIPSAVERLAAEYAARLVTASARRHAAANEFNAARKGIDHKVNPDDFPDIPAVEFPDPEVIDPGPEPGEDPRPEPGPLVATTTVDVAAESWDPRR